MLTVQVLTKDNAGTIEDCINSLSGVDCRVLVGDMGSTDGTREMAKSLGAEVVEINFDGDFSRARNALLSDGCNVYLEPWERLARGSDLMGCLQGSRAFYVIESGVVSKQIRFWEGSCRFENPVFENLVTEQPAEVEPRVVLVSEGRPDRRSLESEMCRKWVESRPTSPEPYYYLACSLLAEGKVADFVSCAKTYLSMVNPSGDSPLLMNYYLSRVEFGRGNARDAYRRALGCLVAKPSFAEFWCLLGDMFCHRGDYKRAIHMYKNAIVAGARRRSDDFFPIEISKYESYPMEMEKKCLASISNGVIVGSKRP